jgi:GNAT superfamily N-acetyltransferase
MKLEQSSIRSAPPSGSPPPLTEREVQGWVSFMRDKNVPEALLQQQLEIIKEKRLKQIGLTEAQIVLPTREYIGRGIESLVVLPGQNELNEAFVHKSVELVSRTFHPDSNVPPEERPTATWERFFRRQMRGDSYFIESDKGFEGKIGVFDALFVYLARNKRDEPLAKEELSRARLIGIHGLFHYLPDPTVYYGIRLALNPELQGRGIGRKIMSHNFQQCLRLGATERQIFTEADPSRNKKVLKIYKGWGFVPTGRSICYNGEKQIFLATALAPKTKAFKMATNFDREDGPSVV